MLPEPVQSGIVGALLGAGAHYTIAPEGGLMMKAAGSGALSLAAAYVAPMVTADPMYQVGAAGAVGFGAGYFGVGDGYLPGGLLNAAIPAASLYVARVAM